MHDSLNLCTSLYRDLDSDLCRGSFKQCLYMPAITAGVMPSRERTTGMVIVQVTGLESHAVWCQFIPLGSHAYPHYREIFIQHLYAG